ncbi:hypothetical protein KOW79_017690 [Hemibagrus wyckioides]|uniref:VIT domain-containing protein n=1 Tax=Hemibagrus wyckioides TaxID=337641 RepID=A0A9D3NAI3_9TELE|nr:hypothetical protein KOW79_017690 [Hemibagrus wyckioides]
MQKVKINCIVTSRIAHTVMTSTALNKANISQEFYFEVELPKTAFITNFSIGFEIVVAGRLNDSQQNTFLVEVSAQMLEEAFVVQGEANAGEWVVTFPEQENIFGDFTERLWAYLTIQQLLNKQYI